MQRRQSSARERQRKRETVKKQLKWKLLLCTVREESDTLPTRKLLCIALCVCESVSRAWQTRLVCLCVCDGMHFAPKRQNLEAGFKSGANNRKLIVLQVFQRFSLVVVVVATWIYNLDARASA